MNGPKKESTIGKLQLKVYANRHEMGIAAATHTADLIKSLLKQKSEIRMVFAAAPSQQEFLQYLCSDEEIDWQSITAFHMDEYVGLSTADPARFANFLDRHLFSKVPFGHVHRIKTSEDICKDCQDYARLLTEEPIDIVCLGIGENGHIAFNDPGVADFHDHEIVKAVSLDNACRQQQVHDGCFPSLDAVPTQALTLTVPTLVSAPHLVCVVPGSTKSSALHKTLFGPINEQCPASILRTHDDCVLFADTASYGVNE